MLQRLRHRARAGVSSSIGAWPASTLANPGKSNKVFVVSGPSQLAPLRILRSLRRSSSPSARCTHGRRRVLSVRRRRGAAALPQRPRLRRHALELLVRQAPRWHRAPAVMCQVHMTAAARDAHLWTCSQASHARQQAGAARAPSSALSATGASGLFRSPLLQSRCLEAAIFATDLRLRLRRLSARRLPSLGPDPAALAHPVEVPRGYAVACVCGYRTFGYRCCTRILIGCFRSPNQLPDGAPA